MLGAANDNGAPPRAVDPLLRLRDVEALTGLGRSTIYRKMADQRFPQPLQLGPQCVRWRTSRIMEWQDALPVRLAS